MNLQKAIEKATSIANRSGLTMAVLRQYEIVEYDAVSHTDDAHTIVAVVDPGHHLLSYEDECSGCGFCAEGEHCHKCCNLGMAF